MMPSMGDHLGIRQHLPDLDAPERRATKSNRQHGAAVCKRDSCCPKLLPGDHLEKLVRHLAVLITRPCKLFSPLLGIIQVPIRGIPDPISSAARPAVPCAPEARLFQEIVPSNLISSEAPQQRARPDILLRHRGHNLRLLPVDYVNSDLQERGVLPPPPGELLLPPLRVNLQRLPVHPLPQRRLRRPEARLAVPRRSVGVQLKQKAPRDRCVAVLQLEESPSERLHGGLPGRAPHRLRRLEDLKQQHGLCLEELLHVAVDDDLLVPFCDERDTRPHTEIVRVRLDRRDEIDGHRPPRGTAIAGGSARRAAVLRPAPKARDGHEERPLGLPQVVHLFFFADRPLKGVFPHTGDILSCLLVHDVHADER
mmetsp:Transcript_34873/g.82726  ORF Transcript_34873/g.82726 Transcript_34873/m.82726 type:complete len:367 (+) Transcript_34873:1268-2368(+)